MHILLIQGAGIGASDRLAADIRAALSDDDRLDAPPMPFADDPQAARWLPAIGEALTRQLAPFVAIGHSLGGSTLLQWLGANGKPAHLCGVLTLSAPFWGEGGWNAGEFSLPAGASAQLADVACLMLNGDADETVSADHLDFYRRALPHVQTRVVPGMDHEWTGGAAEVVAAARGLMGS